MLIDVGNLGTARELFVGLANGKIRYAGLTDGQLETVETIIEQIDILRPLGSDGQHGSRHTLWCGCPDVAQDAVAEIVSTNMLERSIAMENHRDALLGIL